VEFIVNNEHKLDTHHNSYSESWSNESTRTPRQLFPIFRISIL